MSSSRKSHHHRRQSLPTRLYASPDGFVVNELGQRFNLSLAVSDALGSTAVPPSGFGRSDASTRSYSSGELDSDDFQEEVPSYHVSPTDEIVNSRGEVLVGYSLRPDAVVVDRRGIPIPCTLSDWRGNVLDGPSVGDDVGRATKQRRALPDNRPATTSHRRQLLEVSSSSELELGVRGRSSSEEAEFEIARYGTRPTVSQMRAPQRHTSFPQRHEEEPSIVSRHDNSERMEILVRNTRRTGSRLSSFCVIRLMAPWNWLLLLVN